MNDDRDIERVLAYWLVDGVDTMPDRVLVAALDRVDRQPQALAPRLRRRLPTVTPTLRLVAAAAAVIVIAVVGVNLARPAPSSVGVPGPTASPSPTPTPSSTSIPSSPAFTGPCDLVSPAEVSDALHLTAPIWADALASFYEPQATMRPGLPYWYCNFFTTGHTSLFVLGYDPEGGANAFAIWKQAAGAQAVPGLGDDAVWDPAQTSLYILKSGRLLKIEPLDGASPTLTREVATTIGSIAVGRL